MDGMLPPLIKETLAAVMVMEDEEGKDGYS